MIGYIFMLVVFHDVDSLRALSVLWKMLTIKQEESCAVDEGVADKGESVWVLAVARSSLDVVMSVTASVILSLLLISGDVEENPGPGPGGMGISLLAIDEL